eukprot:gb/GECG01000054.1/.p1 GENE.gb/GECG01000054.1/~~gb/GECG01000054.1/.p1  ORF type:complete len:232 (+),score=7.44 gb/GECG01000054.1/:1-696(+)
MIVLLDNSVSLATELSIHEKGALTKRIRVLPHLDPRPSNAAKFNSNHFSKLIVWSLTSYDRVLFLDLDAWPVKCLEDVFQLPLWHGQAAIHIRWNDYLINTGVMLIKPKLATYGFLMKQYLLGNWTLPTRKRGTGDQWFLQQVLRFDPLPLGFNVRYPRTVHKNLKQKDTYILHSVLERWELFHDWASNKETVLLLAEEASKAKTEFCPRPEQTLCSEGHTTPTSSHQRRR